MKENISAKSDSSALNYWGVVKRSALEAPRSEKGHGGGRPHKGRSVHGFSGRRHLPNMARAQRHHLGRGWLAMEGDEPCSLLTPPPPSLSAEQLWISKDCSGKLFGVDSVEFMGLFIPGSLLLSGTLI